MLQKRVTAQSKSSHIKCPPWSTVKYDIHVCAFNDEKAKQNVTRVKKFILM